MTISGYVSLRITDNEGEVGYDNASVEIILNPLDIDDDGDGFSENQGDCDDSNHNRSPDVAEIPYDGIDLTDVDGDGYDSIQFRREDPTVGMIIAQLIPVSAKSAMMESITIVMGRLMKAVDQFRVISMAMPLWIRPMPILSRHT